MWQGQVRRSSLRDSINALEADIHHANTLVGALREDIAGYYVQMKLCFSPFTPFLMLLLEWVDCSCFDAFLSCLGLFHILVYRVCVDGMPNASPEERRASLRDFYAVIYPMLKQLEGNIKVIQGSEAETEAKKTDDESEDECGICMEMECKVALPICGHSMCIDCFNDWYVRSRSCPFCRGSLKSIGSGDLWILTSGSDVVDVMTLAKDNLRQFYLYVQNLPLVESPDSLLMYNYLM